MAMPNSYTLAPMDIGGVILNLAPQQPGVVVCITKARLFQEMPAINLMVFLSFV